MDKCSRPRPLCSYCNRAACRTWPISACPLPWVRSVAAPNKWVKNCMLPSGSHVVGETEHGVQPWSYKHGNHEERSDRMTTSIKVCPCFQILIDICCISNPSAPVVPCSLSCPVFFYNFKFYVCCAILTPPPYARTRG